ncbi:aquaporin-1-like isoform X2 [Cheilinus undulatus]|uniref:aquaporin-1-like isoform X2 n=1 Tax=Cheilinus undulatus TaxID=241271 RepID=UPI001BD46AA4|nr:aquaporin-1-like isoform X2 [Cheilinus undulatus]
MSEIRMWAFWRAVVAELLGMTVFVFIGLSAAVGGINNTYPDQEIKVALAFGLAVATLAQCLGHISGAHLNPAITLGMLVNCQMSVFRALFYVMAQMLGALAGSGIVYGIRPKTIESLGVNKLNGISPGQGFGVEFLLTLQLVLCVLAVTDKRRDVNGFAPLAIGLSVGLGHLAGISYTGCGINPARSFGPAVIQNSFEDHWVYWVGPLSGGVVAALLYDFLLAPRDEPFSERTRALFCWGPTLENEIREPLLEEMLGAVTASAIVNGFKRSGSLGVNMLASDVSVGQGFTIEFLATFQLVLCVIAVTDKRRRDVTGSAPLAIGLSVGLGHFAAISFTGCGINPARSFGPAVIRSVMKNHWVYWLGPMCGGVAAALLYDFILYPRTVNLRSRRNVLLHGPEDDTNETEVTEGGNSSPGPSQWPKQ